jgi:hypothetical protein
MLEVRLPAIKKYQTIAGRAAIISFLLGVLIPTFAIITGRWSCPFGDGLLCTAGFVFLTGALSGALVGNVVALLLILIAKRRQSKN